MLIAAYKHHGIPRVISPSRPFAARDIVAAVFFFLFFRLILLCAQIYNFRRGFHFSFLVFVVVVGLFWHFSPLRQQPQQNRICRRNNISSVSISRFSFSVTSFCWMNGNIFHFVQFIIVSRNVVVCFSKEFCCCCYFVFLLLLLVLLWLLLYLVICTVFFELSWRDCV